MDKNDLLHRPFDDPADSVSILDIMVDDFSKRELLHFLGKPDNMMEACSEAIKYVLDHKSYWSVDIWNDCPDPMWWSFVLDYTSNFHFTVAVENMVTGYIDDVRDIHDNWRDNVLEISSEYAVYRKEMEQLSISHNEAYKDYWSEINAIPYCVVDKEGMHRLIRFEIHDRYEHLTEPAHKVYTEGISVARKRMEDNTEHLYAEFRQEVVDKLGVINWKKVVVPALREFYREYSPYAQGANEDNE